MARHIRDEVGVAAILVHNAGIPDGGRACTLFLQSPESEGDALSLDTMNNPEGWWPERGSLVCSLPVWQAGRLLRHP